MSQFTDNYKLYSVSAGEPISPLEDSRRFLTIDRQLLGLFTVFGNGVITGWDVIMSAALSVSVTPGRGHVNFMAAETLEPRSVVGLMPNATNYIYAQAIEQTRFTRDVAFVSNTTLFTGSQMVLLAAAVTNASTITSIDTTVRNDISFIDQIKTLINQHRHRGGGDNPSKIDLQTEVIGQLPGFRIDGIDASKIISGRLDPARIPPLEHGDLLDTGVLTHPQLDSFVRNLSNPNTRLTGELAGVNMLQLWLALKHVWNECDAYTWNQVVMIPGITPDSQTDFVATTAVFDRINHVIQGVPALAGELLTTTFNRRVDFVNAFLRTNIDVGEDTTNGAFFRLTKPFSQVIVESFDNVFANDVPIPGWTLKTVASNDSSTFNSDSSVKADGAYSAKLFLDQSFRVQVVKMYSDKQDWTPFNELEISVETLAATHGQIRMQILSGTVQSPVVLDDFQVLGVNQITTGFLRIVRDLTSMTRDSVVGIVIYTDTSLGWDLSQVVVNIDKIRLNNNIYFDENGIIRFRFSTPQKSKWAGISWDGDDNSGTIRARARTASNFSVFDQSTSVPFSPFISQPGDDPHVPDNTNIEVEIALAAAPGKTASPLVRSVTLSYITQSLTHGLTIDTTAQFLRGRKLSNVEVQDPGDVLIDGRVDVGDAVYGNLHSLQQVDAFGTPVVGVTGARLPLSPIQASREEFILRQSALDGVASVERLTDRSYLITDTLNDRVMIVNRDGDLVEGLASNNVRNVKELYPLTATYNRDAKTLYVCWSTNISYKSVDLSKFRMTGSGLVITLSNTQDKTISVQGPNTQLDGGNILSVLLSDAHAGEIATFMDSESTSDPRIFMNVDPDGVVEKINTENLNYATLVGPRGLPVFVGNMRFIRGLFRPVAVSRTASENWLICNAKPLLTDSSSADVATGVGRDEITSILEIVPGTGEVVFSDNSVDFSLITLGSAVEYNERYVAMAGINADDNPPLTQTSSTTVQSALGTGTVLQTAKTTVVTEASGASGLSGSTTTTMTQQTDFDEINKYRGRVKIVEKSSGMVVYDQLTSDGSYGADVQVDADDNLVIVEKTFDGTMGRGRVVKLDEDGNVFFQFGLTELSSLNDARVLSTGNLVVSS